MNSNKLTILSIYCIFHVHYFNGFDNMEISEMNLQYIYTPGDGKMPKYLAGRDNQIEVAISAFEALKLKESFQQEAALILRFPDLQNI